MNKSGIYVHIPFCRSKCPYCDFYSVKFSEELADLYTMAVVRAVKNSPTNGQEVDSIYFGGGTPILMGAKRLVLMLESIKNKFKISEDCEITLEANPALIELAELEELVKSGFNRISIGVQSAVEEQLNVLGRIHNVEDAEKSVELSRKAGFKNISVDLMLGTPKQDKKSIEIFCKTFCEKVEHISAYMLKVEENTEFGKKHIEKICPDEDTTADLYVFAVNELKKYGFEQYEISNFAKNNLKSRHNTKYWDCVEYLGIGPAAHSFWNSERKYFERDLNGFISEENAWNLWKFDDLGGDFEEYAMLRLRLSEGLVFKDCLERYPNADLTKIKKSAQKLQKHNLALIDDEHIALTLEGFLVSNSAISELLWGE